MMSGEPFVFFSKNHSHVASQPLIILTTRRATSISTFISDNLATSSMYRSVKCTVQ